MAQRTITVLTDDVHGGQAPASQSITFALDAVGYVIDLDDEHAARLRGDLATWIGHARKQRAATAGRARTRAGASPAAGFGVDTAAVRAWGRGNGHQVSDRGRIKADVLAAYGAAQG